MPLKINVLYADKNTAKETGAFWDADNKTWYVPDHKNINLFSKWIDTQNVSLIAKAPFWLGVNQRMCWKCGVITDVIAFASNRFLVYDYSDDDEDLYEWHFQNYFSFFSMPTYIEKEVADIVCARFPFFKLGYSKTVGGAYWANHCKCCGALQGDFHMHEEPGGEFCPIEKTEMQAITLLEVPYKFDLQLSAGSSYATNEKQIFSNCRKEQW